MTFINDRWIEKHPELFNDILEYCLRHKTVRARGLSKRCGCSGQVAGAVLSHLKRQNILELWGPTKHSYSMLYLIDKEKVQALIEERKGNE